MRADASRPSGPLDGAADLMPGPARSEGRRPPSEFKAGWPVVASSTVGIGLGLSPIPFYTIGVFAPHLAKAFGWSYGRIFGGLSITTVIVLAAGPAAGLLADRFGVRRVALVSVALFALSFMTFALGTGSLPLYYASWAAIALLGAGTLPVTWTRAVNRRFETRKGLALGLSLVGTGVFGYVVKPLTAALIAGFGWRLAYVAIGALPLLIALPTALFLFHDLDAPLNAADRREQARLRRDLTPGLTFAEALRAWRFWVLAVAFVPISFAVGGPIPNMENILRTLGFAPQPVILLSSFIGLSVVGGRLAGGWLIDRVWAPAAAFVLLSAPAASCYLLSAGHPSFAVAGLAIAFIGFAAGVEYDLMAFFVARCFGLKSYGAIYGVLYGFFALGAGVGPVIFGASFDRTHSYAAPLLQAAALLLMGASLLLTLGRYRRFSTRGSGVVLAGAEAAGDASPI